MDQEHTKTGANEALPQATTRRDPEGAIRSTLRFSPEWLVFKSQSVVRAAPVVSNRIAAAGGDHVLVAPGQDVFFPPADLIRVPGLLTEVFHPTSENFLDAAGPGDVAVMKENGDKILMPLQDFAREFRSANRHAKILQSPENPDGWQLHELLGLIQTELFDEADALSKSGSGAVVRAIASHKRRVANLLMRPKQVHLETLAVIAHAGDLTRVKGHG